MRHPRPRSIPTTGYANLQRPRSGIELLRLSDIVRRAPTHMRSVHRMTFHFFALYVRGRCVHAVDFEPRECRPGTLICVQPGQVHRWGPEIDAEAIILVFQPSFLLPQRARAKDAWPERFLNDARWPVELVLKEPVFARAREWFDLLERTYREADDGASSALLLRHLLSAALLDIARRAGIVGDALEPGGGGRAGDRLTALREAVERSFRVTRRARDYAEHLGVSTKTLERLCLERLGMSAKAFVDARVVLEAKRLLAHTAMSVSAIGEELGFSEPTNFVKFFRARTKLSPSEARSALAGAPR